MAHNLLYLHLHYIMGTIFHKSFLTIMER